MHCLVHKKTRLVSWDREEPVGVSSSSRDKCKDRNPSQTSGWPESAAIFYNLSALKLSWHRDSRHASTPAPNHAGMRHPLKSISYQHHCILERRPTPGEANAKGCPPQPDLSTRLMQLMRIVCGLIVPRTPTPIFKRWPLRPATAERPQNASHGRTSVALGSRSCCALVVLQFPGIS
jgi:hypothetical protein